MNDFVATWAGYAALGLGALALAYVFPLTSALTELVLKGLGMALLEIFKQKLAFIVWFIKTLSADHSRVMQHAFQSEDDIDPTQRIRRQAAGRE